MWKYKKYKDTKVAEVRLYHEITEWYTPASRFVSLLDEFEDEGYETLVMRIHSPGGSVFEGNAIFNAIRGSKLRTVARVDGIAASMAAVILFAFDEVEVSRRSKIMLHQSRSLTWGTAADHEEAAKLLRSINEEFIKDAVERMAMTREELEEKLQRDWWISAEEAVELKLADRLYSTDVKLPESQAKLLSMAPGALDYTKLRASFTGTTPSTQSSSPITPDMSDTKKVMQLAILATALGFSSNDASESDITAEIDALKRDRAAYKALKEQVDAQRKAETKAALDEAQRAGKFTADERPMYERMAEANLADAKAFLSKLPVAKKPSDLIDNTVGGKPAPSGNGAKKWEELTAMSADDLEAYKAKHPEAYRAAYKAEFGFYPA